MSLAQPKGGRPIPGLGGCTGPKPSSPGGQSAATPTSAPRSFGGPAKPIRSPLIDRTGEAALGSLRIGITSTRLPDDGRQLENLALKVLYLSGQKQILPVRHQQNGIQHLV
jgi:hypothetical protein